MKVLVTGGAGFIGSIMVKRLLEEGNSVDVVDSLERGDKERVDKRAKLHVGSLLNKSLVSSVFSEVFDVVIHFAGYISMGESMENPGMYFENNTYGSFILLEALKNKSVKRFIFSSTAGIYGNPIRLPISEEEPKNPTNPYGESKLGVERMLSWYQKIYGINFVSLRYFNAAGATRDGLLGESHSPETHIIPNAISSALNNTHFMLYGTDYKTKDGTCIRDYIHVEDLVEAHMLAIKKIEKEKGGFFYNVGTGKGFSNKEVIDCVKKTSGIDFPIDVQKRRPGDADELVADVTLIQKELRFSPKYSDLQTIVKTAWEWHKKNSPPKADRPLAENSK